MPIFRQIILFSILLTLLAAVSYYLAVQDRSGSESAMEGGVAGIPTIDLSMIQLDRAGCELRGPNGELLHFNSREKTVLIPKGTSVSGDCFIAEQE